ncbi:hypothetical protein BCR39DRAFT_363937 [Naematelia encephala]|uniref:FAD-binding PCMH-type domain-containing protein n=1 Tax=Naematelia encephala TaxID=71784 RepID=A0A1Y2ALN3_9TREE|nr:hypothetical protein BCR39DRAFT_363937 [Naematelia encephala]
MPVTSGNVLECLQSSLLPNTAHGDPTVVSPDDGRVWRDASMPYNTRLTGSISPAAIVYVNTTQSIRTALKCAQLHHHPVTPRSGGHSYAAYSLGGPVSPRTRADERAIVLDMRSCKSIAYDSYSQTVVAGSGVLVGELAEFLDKRGRVLPTGACPTVGVGGQALAGGFGLLTRERGLLLDNILSIDVVLASGKAVTASPETHADLFWGLRGAGASLAVAHSFTFQTHPAPPQVTYFELSLLPRALTPGAESTFRAVRLFQAFHKFGSESADSRLGLSWHVTPERGKDNTWGTKVEVLGQFSGAENEFLAAIAPLTSVLNKRGETAFTLDHRSLSHFDSLHNLGGNWTRLKDRGPMNINEHVHFYAKSMITKRTLPMSSLSAHLARLLALSAVHNPSSNTEWFILAPFLGGANSAIKAQNDSAFAHRDLQMVWEIYAKRIDEEEESTVNLIDLVQNMVFDLPPIQAVYPAYIDSELVHTDYARLIWGDLYPRLREIKTLYDLDDLFRYPQSVKPIIRGFNVKWVLVVVVCFVVFVFRLWWTRPKRTRRSRPD